MHQHFSDWREQSHICAACGWQGFGRELAQGELFTDCVEMDCPKCHKVVATVMHPTLEESRANWDKLSPADRAAVESVEARQALFEAQALRRPEQLPDLPGNDLVLTWDIESSGAQQNTVIRFGAAVLWRELAFYEGFERFVEVVEILAARYGTRLQDVVPTGKSELYLYGDAMRATAVVDACRKRLATRRASI